MCYFSIQHGIFKFKLKTLRRPDFTDSGQCPPEHDIARLQSSIMMLPITFQQFPCRQHRTDTTLLVKFALIIIDGIRTHQQGIPMVFYLLHRPQHVCHWLITHLFGNSDAVGFNLAVGMV